MRDRVRLQAQARARAQVRALVQVTAESKTVSEPEYKSRPDFEPLSASESDSDWPLGNASSQMGQMDGWHACQLGNSTRPIRQEGHPAFSRWHTMILLPSGSGKDTSFHVRGFRNQLDKSRIFFLGARWTARQVGQVICLPDCRQVALAPGGLQMNCSPGAWMLRARLSSRQVGHSLSGGFPAG